MDKEEYLAKVTEQIRFEKARGMVAKELEDHIEDQKDGYLEEGMEEKEAYAKAVEEMGNPVDVGVEMDRIHRPKMEWKMIGLVFFLSIMGIGLQLVMHSDYGSENYPYNINQQIMNVIIGFGVMVLFCFIDYTRIGLYAKAGAAFLNGILLLSLLAGPYVGGQRGYLEIWHGLISLHLLMYLYIPFYGGILYAYKNQGKWGLLKSILWMLAPVLLCSRMPNISLSSALFIIMLVQMGYVMRKGWFHQTKKSTIVVGCLLIGYPLLLGSYLAFFGKTYQRTRMLAIFSGTEDLNYATATARQILTGSNFLGKSADGIGTILPETASDFIVTYVCSYYGILGALVLISILLFFARYLLKISISQKNQLGLSVGLGCSMVFAVQICMYVLVNLTVIPTTSVYLPFFSYGRTGAIVMYALIGILLSIYRYQNVIPEKQP